MKTFLWILGGLFVAGLIAWLVSEQNKTGDTTEGITNPDAKAILAQFDASAKSITDASQVSTTYAVNNQYQLTELQNKYNTLAAKVATLETGAFA